ncbi:uncharacterized protein LOC142350745 isoform X2 [Convolutriloba macropyga]|uniref:uncharacterized protein LOC142350745 isoform X2 n=1 Tax=Convolutriloba macropyga TaxID=536237 RepID=UPI003F528F92
MVMNAVIFSFVILYKTYSSSAGENEDKEGDVEWIKDPPCPEWESLVFRITNQISEYGLACQKHSDFYCLDAYQTQNTFREQNSSKRAMSENFGYEPIASRMWFSTLIKSQWQKINMIDVKRPYYCCDNQVEKYLIFGLLHKSMSPDQYMFKLTDYDDEDKPLNFISAFYMPHVCQNLILDIGFGPGKLRRDHHNSVVAGAPYVLAGKELGGIGIPKIPSKQFDFENPGDKV